MIKFSAARLEKEPIPLCGSEGPEFLDLSADDEIGRASCRERVSPRV